MQQSDVKKLQVISLVRGLVVFLDKQSKGVLMSNFDGFLEGLVWVLTPDLQVVQDTYTAGYEHNLQKRAHIKTVSFPRKQFVNFADERVLEAVYGLLDTVGSVCGHGIVDLFLGVVDGEMGYQGILCLAGLAKSANETSTWIESVFDTIIALPVLQTPTTTSDRQLLKLMDPRGIYGPLSVSENTDVVLRTSAILEAVSILVRAYPRDKIDYVVMDGLYTLLEKFGDANYTVSAAAGCALEVVAEVYAGEGSSISSLVLKNMDYLIDSISQKLGVIHVYPMTPKVLVAAIRVGGKAVVGPLMRDCVETVVRVLDEMGTGGYIEGVGVTVFEDGGMIWELLNVLYVLVDVMTESIEETRMVDDVVEEGVQESNVALPSGFSKASPAMQKLFLQRMNVDEDIDTSDQTPSEFFKTYHETKKEDEHESSGTQMATDETDSEEPLTDSEALAITILDRIHYFLSCDSPRVRAIVLRSLALGLPLLSNRPTLLNPLIHKLWSSLIAKCKDPSHFVALDALSVIGVISKTTRDFVRQRVQGDVIDELVGVISLLQTRVNMAFKSASQLHGVSRRTTKISAYVESTTIETRLYTTALDTLHEIIRGVPLKRSTLCDIAFILIGFMNTRLYQPGLQDTAVTILGDVIGKGIAAWVWMLVWLALDGGDIPCDLDTGYLKIGHSFQERYRVFGDASDFLSCSRLLKHYKGPDGQRLEGLLLQCGAPNR